jgi:acyl dehydratase
MRIFRSPEDVLGAVGEALGTTDWRTVSQDQIDLFADATDDHQWIHIDPERAAAGPFGATIAHGYLTLSLLAAFGKQLIAAEGAQMSVNYGLDKVRFLTPVRVGSRVRDTAELTDARAIDGGVRISIRHTVEIDGATKPALVADSLSLLVW